MANTIVKILHEYQKCIANELKDNGYMLSKAPAVNRQGIDAPSMVIPEVTTGCLPHSNFSLYGAGNEFFQAPYVLVGFEDNSTDFDDSKTQLLVQVCCYSSGAYVNDTNDERYSLNIPDNKAFEDCLNLLEFIKQKLIAQGVIAGTAIERPIRLGTYNTKELTYPYSFGYLSFEISSTPQNISRSSLY